MTEKEEGLSAEALKNIMKKTLVKHSDMAGEMKSKAVETITMTVNKF